MKPGYVRSLPRPFSIRRGPSLAQQPTTQECRSGSEDRTFSEVSTCFGKEAGKASGATNTIRELGGVFGVSVLATVFAGAGGYLSPQDFVDGIRAALPIGATVLLVGALIALLIPKQTSPGQSDGSERDPGAGEADPVATA